MALRCEAAISKLQTVSLLNSAIVPIGRINAISAICEICEICEICDLLPTTDVELEFQQAAVDGGIEKFGSPVGP